MSYLRLKWDEGVLGGWTRGLASMHFVFVSFSVFVFDTQSGRGSLPILKLISAPH